MQTREYCFKQPEWSNWKGRLCEELAMDYIREIFIPELRKREKWQHIFVMKQAIFRKVEDNVYFFDEEEAKRDFFLFGVYPSRKLLNKFTYISRALSLEHCFTDGLIVKLNETGKTKRLQDPISRLRLPPEIRDKDVTDLPIVDGKIEILEIKSRKSPLRAKQKSVYNSLIMKGFPLRLFHVHMISFDENKFTVEERRVDEPYST